MRAEQRRQKIVAAARKLFRDNGFHATGVAQIAKDSGVAVAQIYRDFTSKEAIVAAIAKKDCIALLCEHSLRRGIEAGDAGAVWAWLQEFLESERDDTRPLLPEIVAESSRNERISEIFKTTREDVRNTMLVALSAMAPGDHLAERRSTLVDLILAMSLGLMQDRLLRTGSETSAVSQLAFQMIKAELTAMQDIAPPAGKGGKTGG